MHLLIVDDDRDAADSLAELMMHLVPSAQVALAYDGIEALAMLAAPDTHLDVIVMDLEMPGMDGITVATRVRSARGTASPLMIAVTGHAGLATEPAVTVTFDHLLLKPLDVDALVGLLSRLQLGPVQARTQPGR